MLNKALQDKHFDEKSCNPQEKSADSQLFILGASVEFCGPCLRLLCSYFVGDSDVGFAVVIRKNSANELYFIPLSKVSH